MITNVTATFFMNHIVECLCGLHISVTVFK